jgi:hypothetical protein
METGRDWERCPWKRKKGISGHHLNIVISAEEEVLGALANYFVT